MQEICSATRLYAVVGIGSSEKARAYF